MLSSNSRRWSILLPTSYYLLPTTCYLPSTTYHLLPTTYYLLLTTAYHLLPYYLLAKFLQRPLVHRTTCDSRLTTAVPLAHLPAAAARPSSAATRRRHPPGRR